MRRTTFAGVLAIAASILLFSDLASMQGRRRDVQLVNGREAVAREVLVKFRNPAVAAAPAAAVGDADVEAVEQIGATGLVRLRSRSLNAAALVAQFAARPDVLYAEPNYIVRAVSGPNDPSFPQLWGLENVGQIVNGIMGRAGSDIRAVPAWDITVGSTTHVVAVIDTGIDDTHPDLAANMWSAPAPFTVDLGGGIVVTCAAGTHGFNAIQRSCNPMDDHGHGTHVAGTIGAVGNNGLGIVGVNWTTRMMAIKFLDETGSGSIADAISGIRFAVAVKRAFPAAADVRVLSNSWGSLDFSQALLDEITATAGEEMLFVAAAGNYGISNDVLPMFPASYDVPTVVSVAATTNTNDRAYFSNYGPTTVHLGAPGADILSTLPGNRYGFASGTSMAAPHVSGAAVLVLSRCELDTAALKDALIGTVQPMAALASITITGGRLDVNSAIHSCIAPPEPPQNLIAGAGDGRVLLSWDSSLGATSYDVKRSQTAGGPYTTIAADVKGAFVIDPDVVNGVTYYYVVSAANSLGESGDSGEASATPNTPSDLVVSAVAAPDYAAKGSTVAVTVTTKNQGGGPASATTTRLYLSADWFYDGGDRPLEPGLTVPGLAPGETSVATVSVTIPAETPVGVIFLIGRADDNDVLPESNEFNNTRWRSIAIGPDLTISAFTAPSTAAAGASIEVSDTVANKGASSAGASSTMFYLSTNGTFDASDTLLAGTRTVPALAAGASSSGTTTVTIPAATGPGTYYLFARADGGGAVEEAVETNNTAARILRIGSDLAVSSFTAPSGGGAGSVISVTDTTTNQGAGAAAATVTRFYLSANTVVDASDTPLGARAVPALAAGASSTATTSLTIPASTPTAAYYLLALADGDNSVVETNEYNNMAFRSFAVGGDLRVTALTLPAMAGPGDAITVGDTTANQGSGPIGATTTMYYFSTNLWFDSSDVVLGGRSVPALPAGVSHTGSATVTVPPDLSAGTYYIIARADGSNAEAETVETNNDYARSFQVGGDLRVTAFSAPAKAGASAAIDVSDTTVNQGAATVPPTVTRFYLSVNAALDAADRLLGGRPVPSLAPGASSSGSATVTIPADVGAGAYYLFAKADGDDAVVETQEWNNTMLRTIGIGPDLIVSSISAPTVAASGAVVSVVETTLNQGGGSAPASVTTFFLSKDFMLDSNDVPFGGSRSVGPLAAGAASAGTTVVTIPPDTAPGTYYIIAKADGGGSIAESYETNNTRGSSIRIGPDLVISSGSLSVSTITAGSSATLTNTVTNQGAGLAASSLIAFYLSKDLTVDAADVPLSPSRMVPELATGASSAASTVVTIPAATPAGTWYVLARADAEAAVAESVETNNVRFVGSIQVTTP
ncbi:MAG TPA: CARDB domain-containing protein [Vicinamibacterales bacterium]|nr:CARDB domain-containing protein [Vicinamibacterales bacterium]